MKYYKSCTICGDTYHIKLTDKEYEDFINKNDLIQNIFPNFNPTEREFLKTGYCPDCQAMLFGAKYDTDKIKKEI